MLVNLLIITASLTTVNTDYLVICVSYSIMKKISQLLIVFVLVFLFGCTHVDIEPPPPHPVDKAELKAELAKKEKKNSKQALPEKLSSEPKAETDESKSTKEMNRKTSESELKASAASEPPDTHMSDKALEEEKFTTDTPELDPSRGQGSASKAVKTKTKVKKTASQSKKSVSEPSDESAKSSAQTSDTKQENRTRELAGKLSQNKSQERHAEKNRLSKSRDKKKKKELGKSEVNIKSRSADADDEVKPGSVGEKSADEGVVDHIQKIESNEGGQSEIDSDVLGSKVGGDIRHSGHQHKGGLVDETIHVDIDPVYVEGEVILEGEVEHRKPKKRHWNMQRQL